MAHEARPCTLRVCAPSGMIIIYCFILPIGSSHKLQQKSSRSTLSSKWAVPHYPNIYTAVAPSSQSITYIFGMDDDMGYSKCPMLVTSTSCCFRAVTMRWNPSPPPFLSLRAMYALRLIQNVCQRYVRRTRSFQVCHTHALLCALFT